MKPITLHGHAGPNPWKIALIFEELGLPYEMKIWATEDQKRPPFTTTLNPNGFTPVIEDPNTNIVLWESGAIIEYILETYDGSHQLSFPASSPQDRALTRQYSFFHATLQGPALSAALYFTRQQNNPQARQRYVDESIRALGVLEGALKDKEYLVGGRISAADLLFVPYFWSLPFCLGADKPDLAEAFPNVDAWINRMSSRASVKKAASERGVAFAAAAAAASQTQQKSGK